MRKSLTLLLAAATMLAAGGAAQAQTEPRPGPRNPTTRAEVEQRTGEMFGRMDLNADGVLDDADREAVRRQAFDMIDADKDGTISFAEFEARRDDRREVRDEQRGPGPDGPRLAGPGPDAPGPDAAGFGRRGMHGDRDLARTADADQDGTVTQAEFTTAALAKFDRADADSDGTISLEERREARQHKRHTTHRGRHARDDG